MKARRSVFAAIGLVGAAALAEGQAVSPSASDSSISPAIHIVAPLGSARGGLLAALEAEGRKYLADATSIGTVFVWGIVCWGAFRRVHDVTRRRSALAWLATALAFFPFVWSLQFIQLGMFGASVTPLR